MTLDTVKSKKHLHTYERMKDRPLFWRCVDPYCTHYTAKALVEGKAALCKYCGNQYIIDKYNLKLKIPHCADCTRLGFGVEKPRRRAIVVADKLMGKIFGDKV